MKNLILALSQANLPPNGIESVLTEFEVWVDSEVLRSKEKLMIETITPLQRETDGIRNEIRFLAETMKQGFEKSDQKLDFTRKHLELQMKGLELQMDSTRKNLEMQIASSRENLETQIKANDKQLGLVQKLLWLVLTLVLGLFAKAIHLV